MGFNAVFTMSAKFKSVLALPISFLFISSQVVATVSDSAYSDICSWHNAMPVLYHEYGTDVCRPMFVLKNGVDCQDSPDWGQTCASFCQMRTTFYYGPEQPYASMPMCTGGLSCTLSESQHVGYNVKGKLNGNFKQGALTLGITGGFNEKTGQSQSFKYSKALEHGECGYFTFIPIHRITCGTYSEGYYPASSGPCWNYKTVGNACAIDLMTVEDHFYWFQRVIRGVAVFVYLDCATLEPLPDDRQEAPFNAPGVRLPRGLALANAYKTMWNASQHGIVAAQSATTVCAHQKIANATDCLDVLADVFNRGGDMVPTDNAFTGQGVIIGASENCAMYLIFGENWAQTCQVSLVEVLAAAQSIYDTCTDNNAGMVGGEHPVRRPGDCGATVALELNPTKK